MEKEGKVETIFNAPAENTVLRVEDPNQEISLIFNNSEVNQYKHKIMYKLLGEKLQLALAGEKRADAKKQFQDIVKELCSGKKEIEITGKDGKLILNLTEPTRGSK